MSTGQTAACAASAAFLAPGSAPGESRHSLLLQRQIRPRQTSPSQWRAATASALNGPPRARALWTASWPVFASSTKNATTRDQSRGPCRQILITFCSKVMAQLHRFQGHFPWSCLCRCWNVEPLNCLRFFVHVELKKCFCLRLPDDFSYSACKVGSF